MSLFDKLSVIVFELANIKLPLEAALNVENTPPLILTSSTLAK